MYIILTILGINTWHIKESFGCGRLKDFTNLGLAIGLRNCGRLSLRILRAAASRIRSLHVLGDDSNRKCSVRFSIDSCTQVLMMEGEYVLKMVKMSEVEVSQSLKREVMVEGKVTLSFTLPTQTPFCVKSMQRLSVNTQEGMAVHLGF